MTFPVVSVNTVPYCGSCGRQPFQGSVATDLHEDLICDGCGADLLAFGWAGFSPPAAVVSCDNPGAGQVTVTFTANPQADSTDMLLGDNVEPDTLSQTVTSPVLIGAFTAGNKITVQLRSVLDGFPGPWGDPVACTLAP